MCHQSMLSNYTTVSGNYEMRTGQCQEPDTGIFIMDTLYQIQRDRAPSVSDTECSRTLNIGVLYLTLHRSSLPLEARDVNEVQDETTNG